MGAHSLGRARRGNSGYNGQWTPGRTNVFDNEFYSLLVAPDIVYQNVVSEFSPFCSPITYRNIIFLIKSISNPSLTTLNQFRLMILMTQKMQNGSGI